MCTNGAERPQHEHGPATGEKFAFWKTRNGALLIKRAHARTHERTPKHTCTPTHTHTKTVTIARTLILIRALTHTNAKTHTALNRPAATGCKTDFFSFFYQFQFAGHNSWGRTHSQFRLPPDSVASRRTEHQQQLLHYCNPEHNSERMFVCVCVGVYVVDCWVCVRVAESRGRRRRLFLVVHEYRETQAAQTRAIARNVRSDIRCAVQTATTATKDSTKKWRPPFAQR